MTLRDSWRKGVSRVAESLGVFRKNVFDLEGVPAFRQYYDLFVFPWKFVYKGYYDAWHDVAIRTIKDHSGAKKRRMATMNAGQMVSRTLARYIWGEKCEITVNQKNYQSDKPDPLNEYLQHVLRANSFDRAFGEYVEKALALGGAAIKEWAYVPKDKNGKDIGEAEVRLSFHMADQFIPTAWDNHKIKDALFISREAKDGYYYSIVEWHKWNGETYRVTNDLYRLPVEDATEPQNILGWWYPLNLIYPLLSPSTDFERLEHSMFQYIRPFGANSADDNSPLGMSVYNGAMDTLRSLDVCYDSFCREFVLGKKRIIVPSSAIRHLVDRNGQMHRWFDASDEVYQTLDVDEPDQLKIHDNSIELRVEEHVSAINTYLSILCAQVGFDPGILSFSASQGLKTATEVISQNSKTYSTVQNHQNNLRDALEGMVDAILELSVWYDIKWNGERIADLIKNGYSKAIKFDDSIIQDRQANIDEGIKLMGASALSKRKFMIETLGYTPEEADAEIKQIAEESRITAGIVDVMEITSPL